MFESIIKLSDKDYPSQLKSISKPPKKIHIDGEKLDKLLVRPTLGVVGSRKATPYGRKNTERFAGVAARRGAVIVSGLALGIDSIAHQAAIDCGGKTIAVMPSGLGNIYPASHRALAKKITAKHGALISEYDDDFRPRRESFIERNRLIAALSDVLLVTEAAEKSGSLHTANFALEQGKTVLAVPGNIDSFNSAGTNNLIKSGALPVTSEEDILEALNIDMSLVQKSLALGDNKEETLIIQLIDSGLTAGDELQVKSELPIELFQQTLSMLEIKGVIRPLGNNHWRLV